MSQLDDEEARNVLNQLRSKTQILRTIGPEDIDKSSKALAVMIHSHNMDVDRLAEGEIQGNGPLPLLARRGLDPRDLGYVSLQAKDLGYIGTASGTCRLKYSDSFFISLFTIPTKDC